MNLNAHSINDDSAMNPVQFRTDLENAQPEQRPDPNSRMDVAHPDDVLAENPAEIAPSIIE